MANDKIIRSRNWFLVSYLSMEEITDYCKMGHISRYAFIKHDKDENKEPHIHLLVVYKNARTWSAVKKDFENRSQNTMVEVCTELSGAYDYLTHARNPEKFQYSTADIVSDDPSYWTALVAGEMPNRATELISDILDGKNPIYMLKKYGRDYVLNAGKYYTFAQSIGTMNEQQYIDLQNEKLERENALRNQAVKAIDDYIDFINYEPFEPTQEELVYFDEDGNPCTNYYD